MPYDPVLHHRRSIRLRGYDYALPGAYFVTLCTQRHALFFEDSDLRAVATECWQQLPQHFAHVTLDAYVIMPNHLHGVLMLASSAGDLPEKTFRRGVQLNAPPQDPILAQFSPQRDSLAVIVRTYKAAVTTRCRRAGHYEFAWQRGYWEHIVRSEEDLWRIRQYILDNPAQWAADRKNPAQRP